MSHIQILINGETRSFETRAGVGVEAGAEAGIPLSILLKTLRIETAAVAIAVNGEILPPSLREGAVLRAGDRLEIVRAVAGG